MSVITRFLPKRLLSRWVGYFMHWRGPIWWARSSIYAFASFYKINLAESERPYYEYNSIGDFFIRRLKAGSRPVGSGEVLHPADSRITQASPVAQGALIQAKGLTYNLNEFTQDPNCFEKWGDGFFLTYYLCPTDYHRVHSPVDGVITAVRHMPGDLWPVNDWSTSNIVNLFGVNERVLVEIQTSFGPVAAVFVGATNVGHICLSFDESIHGNQSNDQKITHKKYEPGIAIKKGEELGMFRMGSTMVMIYPAVFKAKYTGMLNLGPQVRVNTSLILEN